jgi:hypothetical protein
MTKKALCLSGGGAKGSFQMGAIKCLYEAYGFRPDLIAGTSVGSVNGIKLAAAPPPTNNDAGEFLERMSRGEVDVQLLEMKQLEMIWNNILVPGDFFEVRPPFSVTPINEAIANMNTPDYSGPLDVQVGNIIDTAVQIYRLAVFIPIVNIAAGEITAEILEGVKVIIRLIDTENSLLDMGPLNSKLRDPNLLNLNNVVNGTPLYLALVSLENGRLRYATNIGGGVRGDGTTFCTFLERDGVTPVVTALMDSDIDEALDENSQPVSETTKTELKAAVQGYKDSVEQIRLSREEYNGPNTANGRRAELARYIDKQRERGNHSAGIARQLGQGLRISAKIDPVVAVLGSAAMPVYFDPLVNGVERYIDGGVREIIPVEIALRHGVDQLVGILCSTPELPETDSMARAGLIAVASRSLTEIALDEVVVGDVASARQAMADVRFISPEFDVHDVVVVQPSLIEINMHYGWMRAADEMQTGTPEEKTKFRQLSNILTRLRISCLESERSFQSLRRDLDNPYGQFFLLQKDLFQELRIARWAIMQLASRRDALGLPRHPAQAAWSMEWEREFRGTQSSLNVWSRLETPAGNEILPALALADFKPDHRPFVEPLSDTVYWLVRGAVFTSPDGSLPPTSPGYIPPFQDQLMSLPSGTHEFLPLVPSGLHLMTEVEPPGQPPGRSGSSVEERNIRHRAPRKLRRPTSQVPRWRWCHKVEWRRSRMDATRTFFLRIWLLLIGPPSPRSPRCFSKGSSKPTLWSISRSTTEEQQRRQMFQSR